MKTSQCTENTPSGGHVAFFAGSFDPFTVGHEDIVMRALRLFDEVIVAIGHNPAKPGFLTVDDRKRWIEACLADVSGVRVIAFDGLAADAARRENACCFIKGVRSVQDYEYEMQMAQANKDLCGLDTLMLYTSPRLAHVSSSLVRELHHHGRDVSQYLPATAPLQFLPR